jgi:hypothetical protein
VPAHCAIARSVALVRSVTVGTIALEVAVGKSAVRAVQFNSGMPQNFIACDREQVMLLPPSLLDWVSPDHLVWTVLASVEELDLSAFYGGWIHPVDATRWCFVLSDRR